jgi:hypothetical protein
MTAGGVSLEEAQADLCRMISDGVIGLRGQLDRHAHRPLVSSSVVSDAQLEIPIKLEPGDFDWQESRPTAPWFLREFEKYHNGPWHFKRIELSRENVTSILLRGGDAAVATGSPGRIEAPRRRERKKSKRVIAENAIREIWPEGPPPREKVSDGDLIDRVSKHMKRTGASTVSPDTILRAAGRK